MNMLVVIDSRVEAYPMLAAGVRKGAKVLVIDPNFDGIEQITQSLAEHPASSLHIVCHGEPGTLYLGKTPLNGANLETYRHQLQQWHVTDILLYACNVAALEHKSRRETNNLSATSATNFLHRFHQLTKANIAASNHRVGSTHLGGNWELEIQIGEIITPIAFLPAALSTYQGVLAENFIWAKGIGGTDNDGGKSIAVDSNGNTYIIGSLNGAAGITKLDSDGNLVWTKNTGGIGNDIAIDDSGNSYITGSFSGSVDFDPGSGVFNLTGKGNSDIFFTKLDSTGNLVWAKQIGSNGNELASSIAVDSGGNIYTTGYFSGTVDFDPGSGVANLTSGGIDIFVTKLNSSGNLAWVKQFKDMSPAGIVGFNLGNSIVVDSSGNSYTTGRFSSFVDFDPGPGITKLTPFVFSTDIFVTKLDSNGNLVWVKQMGGNFPDEGISIAVDSNGNTYTTGLFNLADIFVSKQDSSGNLVWVKNFGDAGNDTARSIAVDSSGNSYITGTLNGAANSFIKLDSSGNIVWVKNLGGAGNDIAIDSNDNLYITGGFNGTADFDPGSGIANLTSNGGSDIFVTKLGNSLPTISINNPTVVEGTGGSNNLTFTITLSDASTVPISVDYLTVDGTATADSDYTKTEKVTTKFNPGDSLTKTISIPITTDNINEADETFYVQLSNAVNAKISSTAGKGTGTIINDDTPTVSIDDVDDVTVTEGTGEGTTTANFTVTLSNPTDIPVTVNYTTADGTATAGKDYTTTQGTLTFDAKSGTTQNIAVDIIRDNINEADETFTVNLTNTGASNATASATGTIINDDTPTISITDVSQKEGNSDTTNFTFDVTLSNPTDVVVTVDYFTVDDTATVSNNDYISKSGTLNFNPSSSLTQSVTVAVVGENFVETDEVFKVKLSNPTNATIAGTGEGIGSIINDDVNEPQQPTVSIIPTQIAQFEGNSGTTAYTYNVSLSNPSSVPITVNYSTNDGSATVADIDYADNDGSLTFAPGSLTKTITVQVTGDTEVEADENFTVKLNSASNATIDTTKDSAIGIIKNDDDIPPKFIPNISINDTTIIEGTGGLKKAVFTVQLSELSKFPVSVNYATSDGTAKAGSDYTAIPLTPLIFTSGEIAKTVTVDVNPDSLDEPDETFNVNLTDATNAVIVDNKGFAIILDDDDPVIPVINVAPGQSPSESGSTLGTFIISLNAAAPTPITVNFNTNNSTATLNTDYTFDLANSTNLTAIDPVNSTFTIAAGVTSATLVFNPVDDAEIETGGEIVQLNLDPGVGYRLGYGDTAVAQFAPETSFDVGSFPSAVTKGDFNQDGFTDLVTANQFSDDVSIILGMGDGTFGSATNFSVGSFPIAVTSGDFNQDGFLDLAAVNEFSDNISVLFGTGDGSFGSATNFSVGFDPVSVSAKDLNQDSFIDLVATNFGDNNVSVLLNTKDGSFATATNFSVGSGPSSVTAEDFNQDGFLDLATTNFNTNDISILLGTGDGNFGTATNFSVGLAPNSVTVGDFNQDGFLDLATANQNSDNLSVLLGSGDGSFGTATNLAVEFGPGSVATSDFNGDGSLDLAATNLYSNNVSILLGTGDGNFGAATSLAVGSNPASIVIDDFNQDGKPDLATANQSSDSFSVLLNDNIPTASLTIADNDPVSVEFSAASYQVNEDGTIVEAAVTINRIGDAQSTASVQVQLTNSTASGGSQPFDTTTDFDNTIQTINFASGETIKTVTIPINNDNWVEGNENLTLTLINPSANLVLGTQTTANLTIVDNDVAEISITDVTVAEGNNGTTNAIFTVTLSNPSTQAVTVNYNTSDDTATVADGDYTNIPATLLTFNPGEISKTITVAVNGDEKVEGDETFNLNLSNATNATIVDNKGVAIITNDDVSPIVNNVSSTALDGNYTVGQVIPITVTFSKNVFVSGTPQLTLETGTTDAVASYISGSGSNTLTFNYQVGMADTTADLDYISTNALVINGGTIKDAAGNDAVLDLPVPGTVGSLGANKAIAIPPINNIIGTAGRDMLTGTSGRDRIVGEQVSDTISGGLGNDEFVYNRIQDAGDFIMDFQVGSDKIVMTNLLASLGYSGSNALADGYVGFSARGSDVIVNLDSDGFAGTGRSRLYFTVKNVTVAAMDNPNNFVFT